MSEQQEQGAQAPDAAPGTELVPAGERVTLVETLGRAKKKPGKAVALTADGTVTDPAAEGQAQADAAEAVAAAAQAREAQLKAEIEAELAKTAEQRAAQEAERLSQMARLFERLRSLESERRGLVEDMNAVREEAKEAGIDPGIIDLAVKRHFETAEKRALREARELAADQLMLDFDRRAA